MRKKKVALHCQYIDEIDIHFDKILRETLVYPDKLWNSQNLVFNWIDLNSVSYAQNVEHVKMFHSTFQFL